MMGKNHVSILALMFIQNVYAMPAMQSAFVRAYPTTKGGVLDNCTTCHLPNIKNGMNRFALDLQKANLNFKTVEKLDSDKDGVSNKSEILEGLFPGSKNSNGGGTFTYKNSKGLLHFAHEKHLSEQNYGKKFNCNSCHFKDGFKKEFKGTANLYKLAHKLCLDCHANKNPNSTKAALKCTSCHVEK